MDRRTLEDYSPLLVVGGALTAFLMAVFHHGEEIARIDEIAGPVAALVVDGVPALVLAYAGYWLSRSNFAPEDRRRTTTWCVGGAALFGGTMGLTIVVRVFEGRTITEPLFPLLVAINAGGIAGFVAGYYQSQAKDRIRQVETVSEAMQFVNELLRHDLRNDLTVVRGRANVLADADGEMDDGHAEVIVDNADKALTRIETSEAIAETLVGDSDLESVDLAALAEEMATEIANTYDVTVTTDLPDEALVTGNAGLRSVLDNVLENAVEHNDADEPRVHVAVERTPETVRVEVADNGPGIPDEHKRKLFAATESDASGGLCLVGRLVEEFDGEVWVEDNEPRGSIFVVELPRAGDR